VLHVNLLAFLLMAKYQPARVLGEPVNSLLAKTNTVTDVVSKVSLTLQVKPGFIVIIKSCARAVKIRAVP